MADHRESTRKALFAYLDRSERERIKSHPNRKPARRNLAPEKLVEKECVEWLNKNGFEGQVYESKAVLSGGKWRNAGMDFGHADWMGSSPYGELCAVEFKAKGKRSTFWKTGNERQQDFVLAKINSNAFAVVVDNAVELDRYFHAWRAQRQLSLEHGRKYLMSILPKKPECKLIERPLFDVD